MTPLQPVEYDGRVYPSIRATAAAFGVAHSTVQRALTQGHWHGKPIKRVGGKPQLEPKAAEEDAAIRAYLAKCRTAPGSNMHLRKWGR